MSSLAESHHLYQALLVVMHGFDQNKSYSLHYSSTEALIAFPETVQIKAIMRSFAVTLKAPASVYKCGVTGRLKS